MNAVKEELNARTADADDALEELTKWLRKYDLYNDDMERYSDYIDEFIECAELLTEGLKADEIGLFSEDYEDLMDLFEESYGIDPKLDKLFYEVEEKISTEKAELLVEPLQEHYQLLMQNTRTALNKAHEFIMNMLEDTD